jgi:hypothetical protein
MNNFFKISIFFILFNIPIHAHAEEKCIPPLPFHQKLLTKYSNLVPQLEGFAVKQGFTNKCNIQLAVIHELVHIESVALGGFAFERGGAIPYYGDPVWGDQDLKYFYNRLNDKQKKEIHNIYKSYILRNGKRGIPTVLDEINAYSQSLYYCNNDRCKRVLCPYLRSLSLFLDYILDYLRNNQIEKYTEMVNTEGVSEIIKILKFNSQFVLKDR